MAYALQILPIVKLTGHNNEELYPPFLILLAVLLTVQPAAARMACGPHKKLTKALTGKYKEARKGLGLVASRRVMEVYVSESGSWTLVMTDLNGISCIIAAGHSWEDAPLTEIKPDT